jgi:hypothetical protein
VSATSTFENALPGFEVIGFGGLALVASEARRPTQVEKSLNTSVFISIFVTEGEEGGHADSSLCRILSLILDSSIRT